MSVVESLQIKRATELLIDSVGVKTVCAITGKAPATVYRWADRNLLDDFIRLPTLRELEAIAPEPLVTMALCRMAGGVFVPHIEMPADAGSLAGMVMQLSKELGDVAGAISSGLADGKFLPSEAEAALRELDDMVRQQAQLRAALQALRDGQPIGDA